MFSSRRIFTPRRSSFAAARQPGARPLARALGIAAATAIVFGAGVYAGRSFPDLFAASAPLPPVTAAEF